MAVATSTNGPAASDDLLRALHEEIARLPEKYRLAVVHCDLEGMTQAQAAAQAGYPVLPATPRRHTARRVSAAGARLRAVSSSSACRPPTGASQARARCQR